MGYPERVAQTLVTKIATEFEKKFGNRWAKVAKDESFSFPQLSRYLAEYANPNADKMLAVQQNLDQIKQIMHKNIEDVESFCHCLCLCLSVYCENASVR